MKIITKKVLLLIATLFLALGSIQAQSFGMTGTVVHPCANNGIISVTVTGLTAPITYVYQNWAAQQTITHSNISATNDAATGISAYQNTNPWWNPNVWNVTATDGFNNSANATFTIIPPFTDSIHVSVANCPAQSTIAAMNFVGGTAPYSCLWTNMNTNATFNTNPATVPSGPYSLLVTDGAGCMVATTTSSGSIWVNNISSIQVNITGTSANCTNGTANAVATGGTAPYTYLWSNSATSQNITGLSMGSINCVVTDNIGCQATGYYYVSQGVNINVNTTVNQATCVQTNGAITTFVTGGTSPYSFLWSNAATTQNLSNLQGGLGYQVIVTDANNCIGNGWAYVGVSTPIQVTFTTTPSSCTSATGGATVFPTGGATPYTITWGPTPSTGASITNKASGVYSFTVTDNNGCKQTGTVFIPTTSTINATANSAVVVCPATTGNLGVSVTGSNPPFTYLWSNSATTSAITGVSLGSYNVVITDAAGCSVTKYMSLTQSNPISVGFNATPASCIFAADGAITANALGGTAPYTYAWSNNQTGATITGLVSGNYYVNVTDANGCHNTYNNSMAHVAYNATATSCYCIITGTVYNDVNSNCTQNSGDLGIPNLQVQCSGFGFAWTNSQGVYSFKVPAGTYTITESSHALYPLSSCQSNNQVVTVGSGSNCVNFVNFSNNTVLVHDLSTFITHNIPPIPGNQYNQTVIVQNNGTMIESGIRLRYTHDGQLGFNTCTPWALTQQNATSYPNWYSMNTAFPILNPNTSSGAIMNYNVPTNIPLNTQVNFHDTVTHTSPVNTAWLTDNSPWNNVDQHIAVVVSSYDPNFKEVSPQGVGPNGDIVAKDSILTYVVHFQNEGTYFAQNIVVVDTLDSDLNIKSVRPGYASHPYTTTMDQNGVLKFHFNNINLPWKSMYGDKLSSGMFSYQVKLKKGLPVGTKITNSAAIYFDYNEPVITNTTLNTLTKPVGINELNNDASMAALYPNPANNYFTLSLRSVETTEAVLTVYDVSGREVSSKMVSIHAGNNSISENTEKLQNGIYFVELKSGSFLIQKKLLIAK